MDISTLSAFAAAFLVFAASPGPDNMTIVARTLSHGVSSGVAYGVGTVAGIIFFVALASLGLSVLASEMGIAMTLLRYGGAAYLVWMGVKLWTAAPVVPSQQAIGEPVGLVRVFLTGFALNLGNPKMPLFYIALLPNLVSTALTPADFGILTVVIVAIEVVVIGGHVALALRARSLLRSPRIVRRVNRIAGGVMIGSGVAVLASR